MNRWGRAEATAIVSEDRIRLQVGWGVAITNDLAVVFGQPGQMAMQSYPANGVLKEVMGIAMLSPSCAC